jgi:hypothetical protein
VIVPTSSPLSVPAPPFVTLTACDAGFVPRYVALKVMLEGLSTMAGGGGLTTSVTLTVCGLLLATLDVTGTVAA